MRSAIYSLITLMLVLTFAIGAWYYRKEKRRLELRDEMRNAIGLLQEKMLYHGALGEEPRSRVGFPMTMHASWFKREGLPINVAAPGRQPWIDIAPEGDMSTHPPDPIIEASTQAGFWYNPNRGVFRARVPRQFSDSATIELYNWLNDTDLVGLPIISDPARQPQPLMGPVALETNEANQTRQQRAQSAAHRLRELESRRAIPERDPLR